ncbi:MAG: class I SAM-dependent methyltransferase [Magnetococcales bacterium]|nr:class I SAM-dependent methyltransferase [Magnetococcales bacterium]
MEEQQQTVHDRIVSYQQEYLSDYGFEQVMVHYRQQMLLQRLEAIQPRRVLEVGCGYELLIDAYAQRGGQADCWVIVEPGDIFYNRAMASPCQNLHVVHGFLEASSDKILSILPEEPDYIICSGLLNEIRDPHTFLTSIRNLMGDNTLLHVNVPNAGSLHRRLAVAMGLMQDLKTFGDRNIRLSQYRVFDRDSLQELLEASGLRMVREGGYFLKPFTHSQMEIISRNLAMTDILEGLQRLGSELPQLAAEIYVETRKA